MFYIKWVNTRFIQSAFLSHGEWSHSSCPPTYHTLVSPSLYSPWGVGALNTNSCKGTSLALKSSSHWRNQSNWYALLLLPPILNPWSSLLVLRANYPFRCGECMCCNYMLSKTTFNISFQDKGNETCWCWPSFKIGGRVLRVEDVSGTRRERS